MLGHKAQYETWRGPMQMDDRLAGLTAGSWIRAESKEPTMSSASNESGDVQDRMMGSVPGVPALGRGPVPDGGFSRHEYDHPAAGWGAARSVGRVLEERGTPVEGVHAMLVMNHEDGGFDCPGCAWPDDPTGLQLDICENGVKQAAIGTGKGTVDLTDWSAR